MIITQTPLRISFLGGNTDFPEYYHEYGGSLLTSTIDKYIYCIVTKRFDDEIWINYSSKEKVTKVEDIQHDLVREALKLVGIEKGIEISFLSDIPSTGSGLGSSSAVVIGLLNALNQFIGRQITNAELASAAVHIEIDVLNKPIGVQDQIAIAYGGLRHLRLGKSNSEVLKLDLPDSTLNDFNNSLMLFYTNKARKAESVLSKVKLDTKILDNNKRLAERGVNCLKLGEINEIGKLLHEYWESKKALNDKVTNVDINIMYKKARKAGAIGGKVVGAGGGGFMLLVVPTEKQESVRKALVGHKQLQFRFDPYGSRVIFNNE